jgi:serine/threonine protein kinase
MSETFPSPFNADYELLGLLGKGGMGSHVYKARQIKLDRIVALKVLDTMGDDEAEKRFYSEAQAMKELNHQNLVTVFDIGMQDNKIFIAMTFVNGQPLSDIIKRERILPVGHATYIADKVATGLEYAHKRGIIHRDIKPSNIMIMENSEPCVIDFGISLMSGSQRLTSTGMTMGTPEYMSPEQCQNKNVTLQSDIYNLGIVFYEMLSGDPPFCGGASLAILNKHLHEKPESLRKKNPSVPPDLERIINKCLEKKVDNRYANFSEFIRDLRAVGNNAQGTDKRSTAMINKLSKTERIILLILCILPVLLIFAIFLLSFKNVPESPPPISYLTPSSSWVIDNKIQPGKSVDSLLFDKNLSTAWIITKESALKANEGKLITIKFSKPVFISHLGIAIGNQSSEDNFQKYNKPKNIWIHYVYNSNTEQTDVQKFSLADVKRVQYLTWTPVEVSELTLQLKSLQKEDSREDFAISEIRIHGMEL